VGVLQKDNDDPMATFDSTGPDGSQAKVVFGGATYSFLPSQFDDTYTYTFVVG
jgi:hypothetical protein